MPIFSIPNNEFEDRIAQMTLALVYTHFHIDVTLNHDSLASLQDVADLMQIGSGINDNLRRQVREHANETYAEQFRRQLTDERASSGTGPSPEQQRLANANEARVVYHARDAQDQSLINYDTCASVIDGDSLYVAFNFKNRQTTNPATHRDIAGSRYIQYTDFNHLTLASMNDVKDVLQLELQDVSNNVPRRFPIYSVNRIVFLSPTEPGDNAQQAAQPHAEMQIVSYLLGRGRSLNGLRFGVSKECCANCAAELERHGARFNARHNRFVSNWASPSDIRVRVAGSFMA